MREGCRTIATCELLHPSCSRTVCGCAQADLERLWEEQQYYKKAVSYWDMQPADVDGVLGGFGHVSAADIRDSKRLLQKACLESPLVLRGYGRETTLTKAPARRPDDCVCCRCLVVS